MKNIVIWDVANYNWLWLPLAKRFKNNSAAKIHFVCSAPQYIKSRKRQDEEGVIDSFITTNHFFTEYDNCNDTFENIISKARYYEDKYNVLVVDILQSDRHLGRGFSAAGVGHPRSELSNKATYIKSTHMFNIIVRFWEDYFDKVKPDLIIGASSGIIGKTCSVIARSRGISIRTLTSSRYQSYFYWATDEYYSMPTIKENFKSINNYKKTIGTGEILNIKRLPWSEKSYKRIMQYRSKIFVLMEIMGQIRRYLSRKIKRIVTMGNYRLSESIRCVWRMHTGIKIVERLKTVDHDTLTNLKYVFYPLHIEPESALGVLSPEFNEQLAAIELLAKNLPADTFLVIKEHIGAIGRRPGDFYSTIKDIPNVLLVHTHEYAIDIAKKAQCVAVFTSTLGTEAVIVGVPVISFGVHNNFNFLPHVHVVESWKELRPLLAKLCAEDTEEDKKRRKRDGMKYLMALKAASVDLHWSDYSSTNRRPATERELEVLYSALMKTLGAQDEVQSSSFVH